VYRCVGPNTRILDCATRNYNVMMMVNAPGAEQIAERSGEVRQQVLDQNTLSRSL
jgi:hypothetical protein